MYMQQVGPSVEWLINMPFWVPAYFAMLLPLVAVFVLWSVVWKGLALWHAARRGEPWWFVVLFLVNTAGILEIVYLFWVAGLKPRELFSKHEHRAHH